MFRFFTILFFVSQTFLFAQQDSQKFYYDYHKILNDTTLISAYKENLTDKEKLTGLSMLWSEAKYNFANFDLVPQLNFDSLYFAFHEKVLHTKSTLEYYKILTNFVSNLRDGHTFIFPPQNLMPEMYSRISVRVKLIENKPVVVSVNDEALSKQIKIGDEVISIDGIPVKEYVDQNVMPYVCSSTPQDSIVRAYTYFLFSGKQNSKVKVELKNSKNKNYSIEAERKYSEWMHNTDYFDFKILKNNIGYLRISSFNFNEVVQKYDSVFSEIQKCNSLIIDIRENGGGNGGNGFEILGTLTGKPFETSLMAMRNYNPSKRAWGAKADWTYEQYDWKPYKDKLFDKPVVVLISGMTFSAAEDFSVAFDFAGRGKLIGEPTGGSTGQPLFAKLPGGGAAIICTKRDLYPDGKEFIGIGVQPDIFVSPKIEDIRKNKDTVLEAAINFLKNEK